MKRHILKKNETLEGISAMYSLPVCMIARANGGFAGGIRYGMEIMIPPVDFCLLAEREYIVEEGESLHDISIKTGSTMREIMHINGISPGEVRQGMKLFLPKNSRIYTVGCGETIDDITERTGFDVAELSELNDIERGIYRGMQIKLPWD